MRKKYPPRPAMSVEDARKLLKEGFCPWCEAGPFRVPLGHITRMHDRDRFQVRDELGFFYGDSLTDPTYHEETSVRVSKQFKEGRTGIHPFVPGTSKTLSQAAIKMQKEKAHRVPIESRLRAAREYGDRRLEEARPRDDRIIELAGEGLTNVEIAALVEVHPRTVWTVLLRNDQPVGAARYHASRKGIYSDTLARGSQTQRAQKAADAAQLIDAYNRGVSIAELARRRGIDPRAVRARLKRYGVNVPDGRADPNRKKYVRPRKPPGPCMVTDCPKPHVARGMCGMHYQRWAKEGRRETSYQENPITNNANG